MPRDAVLSESVRHVAFIPARGGSKSIPGKNIIELNGSPLISYSIHAAQNISQDCRVVVSSDDTEILSVASSLGTEILQRPDELSQDNSPTSTAIFHMLQSLALDQDDTETVIILLQPTSPLRNAAQIDEALALFHSSDATSVISVYELDISPEKSMLEDEAGYLRGICDDDSSFKPRQQLSRAYYPNGAIYIFYASEFLKVNEIPLDKCLPYVMDRRYSVDIDTTDDLQLAERLMNEIG